MKKKVSEINNGSRISCIYSRLVGVSKLNLCVEYWPEVALSAIACRGRWGRGLWFQMIVAYRFVLNESIGQV